jgi:hypothetical protein
MASNTMIGKFAPNQELLVVSAIFAPNRTVCDEIAKVLPIWKKNPLGLFMREYSLLTIASPALPLPEGRIRHVCSAT